MSVLHSVVSPGECLRDVAGMASAGVIAGEGAFIADDGCLYASLAGYLSVTPSTTATNEVTIPKKTQAQHCQ